MQDLEFPTNIFRGKPGDEGEPFFAALGDLRAKNEGWESCRDVSRQLHFVIFSSSPPLMRNKTRSDGGDIGDEFRKDAVAFGEELRVWGGGY